MNTKTRIGLNDTVQSALIKMCDGNPGGLNVLIEIMKVNGRVDPDDFMGGLGPILGLDMLGIYGSRIWILHKDVCGQDIVKTLTLLRANQLGILPEAELNRLIDSGESPDFSDILAKVQKELPNFAKAA